MVNPRNLTRKKHYKRLLKETITALLNTLPPSIDHEIIRQLAIYYTLNDKRRRSTSLLSTEKQSASPSAASKISYQFGKELVERTLIPLKLLGNHKKHVSWEDLLNVINHLFKGKPTYISKTRFEILKALNENPTTKLSLISGKIGKSQQVISTNIQQMISAGILRIYAKPDIRRLYLEPIVVVSNDPTVNLESQYLVFHGTYHGGTPLTIFIIYYPNSFITEALEVLRRYPSLKVYRSYSLIDNLSFELYNIETRTFEISFRKLLDLLSYSDEKSIDLIKRPIPKTHKTAQQRRITKTDMTIIQELSLNWRCKNKTLSKKLNRSTVWISKRKSFLKQAGIIKPKIAIDNLGLNENTLLIFNRKLSPKETHILTKIPITRIYRWIPVDTQDSPQILTAVFITAGKGTTTALSNFLTNTLNSINLETRFNVGGSFRWTINPKLYKPKTQSWISDGIKISRTMTQEQYGDKNVVWRRGRDSNPRGHPH